MQSETLHTDPANSKKRRFEKLGFWKAKPANGSPQSLVRVGTGATASQGGSRLLFFKAPLHFNE
jgi:hypothetical protein